MENRGKLTVHIKASKSGIKLVGSMCKVWSRVRLNENN